MSCCNTASSEGQNAFLSAKNKHYALIGFANSGKSTLFNLLSNNQQKVGNFSGVTVAAKKSAITLNNQPAILSDLPGLSSLAKRGEQGQDLTISQQYIAENDIDCLINLVDINQLSRQLYLTSQLLELGVPMVVVLNKTDRQAQLSIDIDKLSEELGCPVFTMSAQRHDALTVFEQGMAKALAKLTACKSATETKHNRKTDFSEKNTSIQAKQDYLTDLLNRVSAGTQSGSSWSDKLDDFVLHPVIGIPVFLGMMYLLFMFAINVGSAFIDFFDILSGTIFVSYPLHILAPLALPQWLLTIVEGVGSGIQTVATFIPVIACLFIGLSLLETSGYLARAAFVVDSVMQRIGLPGKAFVPLIVGFGCTVPAVMSARVLDSERERITTVMMSPFMSCGARLPVYALFAAAFFPENGQNLVFLLYLIGIAAAIFTGFLLKKTVLSGNSSFFQI